MKVKQAQTQKKEGTAAGFRAAGRGKQSSAAFNPITLLCRSAERKRLQAKLKVGSPGDIYEQEADETAERVMSMPGPVAQGQAEEEEKEEPIQASPPLQCQVEEEEETVQELPLLQRQAEEEEEPLQTKRSEESDPSLGGTIQDQIQSLKGGLIQRATRSPKSTLSSPLRQRMLRITCADDYEEFRERVKREVQKELGISPDSIDMVMDEADPDLVRVFMDVESRAKLSPLGKMVRILASSVPAGLRPNRLYFYLPGRTVEEEPRPPVPVEEEATTPEREELAEPGIPSVPKVPSLEPTLENQIMTSLNNFMDIGAFAFEISDIMKLASNAKWVGTVSNVLGGAGIFTSFIGIMGTILESIDKDRVYGAIVAASYAHVAWAYGEEAPGAASLRGFNESYDPHLKDGWNKAVSDLRKAYSNLDVHPELVAMSIWIRESKPKEVPLNVIYLTLVDEYLPASYMWIDVGGSDYYQFREGMSLEWPGPALVFVKPAIKERAEEEIDILTSMKYIETELRHLGWHLISIVERRDARYLSMYDYPGLVEITAQNIWREITRHKVEDAVDRKMRVAIDAVRVAINEMDTLMEALKTDHRRKPQEIALKKMIGLLQCAVEYFRLASEPENRGRLPKWESPES